MKELLNEWKKYLNEQENDPMAGLKSMFDSEELSAEKTFPKMYPEKYKRLIDHGGEEFYQRFLKAARAADKKEGKVLDADQYIRQADELDKYLGLSTSTSGTSPAKQQVLNTVEKMYQDLRSFDAKFQKDPSIRKKYEAALGAINAFKNSISSK
tara:strand:+ start:153 stop:614 length:462 start_codon:yes stop_codon:yes gene_type:complete